MGTVAVESMPASAGIDLAAVREAASELVARLERAAETYEACIEQAKRLDALSQATRFPRFAIPVWTETAGIVHDLTENRVEAADELADARELVDLIDLASKAAL